jgi:hypothetical protein
VRWLPLWIGLSLLLAIGAAVGWCAMRFGFTALQTRSLPGFEIDLPAGERLDRLVEYDEGRVVVNDPGGVQGQLQLTWKPGGLSGDAEVALVNKALGAGVGAEPRALATAPSVEIAGPKARSWALYVGHETTWATEVTCGARVVRMLTISGHMGVERLHRRMARSFRCRPDASKEPLVGKETAARDVPVVFELEPGWVRHPNPQRLLVLEKGPTILMAFGGTRSSNPDVGERMLTFVRNAFPGAKPGDRIGDDWSFETTMAGKRVRGWLTMRDCPDLQQTLFIVATVAGGDGDGRELLSRARCRKPGEPPQVWPDPPTKTATK